MARWENHGTTSDLTLTFLSFVAQTFKSLGGLIYPIKSIAEVIEYRVWLEKNFGRIEHLRNKRQVLNRLILEFKSDPLRGGAIYEFGVAFGETAQHLIENLSSDIEYHGFDTFEGLPKAWRRLPKGAISNHGKPPEIQGANVTFHKGLIQDTISNINYESNGIKLFIFDFDLYAPTLLAYQHVRKMIKKDDLVYFDEAFDSDERVIIENYFLEDFEYKVIAASPFGLAFKIC